MAVFDERPADACLDLTGTHFLHAALQASVANVIVRADLTLGQAAAEAFCAFEPSHALPGEEALCSGVKIAPERLLICAPRVDRVSIRHSKLCTSLERSVN